MKITRDYLCQLLADRYVEEMSLQELQDFVAEQTYEHYLQYTDDNELREEAVVYGVVGEDELLEIQ